jgi:hypothetical protein
MLEPEFDGTPLLSLSPPDLAQVAYGIFSCIQAADGCSSEYCFEVTQLVAQRRLLELS